MARLAAAEAMGECITVSAGEVPRRDARGGDGGMYCRIGDGGDVDNGGMHSGIGGDDEDDGGSGADLLQLERVRTQ